MIRILSFIALIVLSSCAANSRFVAAPPEEIGVGQNPEIEPVRKEIRDALAGRRPQFRECAEQYFQRHPNGGGRLVARFFIETTGQITETSVVKSELQDVDLEKCVLGVVSTTHVRQPPKTRTWVIYPFIFQSK